MHESVLVAIFDESRKKILLTKRRDIPVWVFPGGRVEKGETPETCALRESKEETGLSVKIVRKIAEYTPRNRLSHYTHFFEAKPTEGTPALSDETLEVAFFDTNKPPYPLPPPYAIMLKHAQNQGPILHCPVPNSSYWVLSRALLKRPDLIIRFILMKLGIHLNSTTQIHKKPDQAI